MKAPVHQPQIKVTLYKNVDRTTAGDGIPLSGRFTGQDREIDLSRWIMDGSSIRTSKSVRDPAGGFSITLGDRLHGKDMDSIYGLVEPMDCIEIRMARNPLVKQQNGGELPIVMRGFISDIRRSESVSGNGKPQRQVIITGQDYGKIWQIFQIFYEKNFPVAASLITEWKFYTKYGTAFKNMSCRDFMRECIGKILNTFLVEMQGKSESGAGSSSPLHLIETLDADITAAPGMVSPKGINQFQGGTLYQMMHSWGDVGPWNELFIEDREDGIYMVYRPNPFYGVDGKFLPTHKFCNPEAVEPARHVVLADEIQSLTVSRADTNVANYFWVDAPRSQLNHGPTMKMYAVQGAPETFMVDHRNSDRGIYGLRKMFEQSEQGDPADQHYGNGLPEKDLTLQYNLTSDWINKRRIELVEQNKDNIVFESGTMRINGREEIRAGTYIEVVRGSINYSMYAVQVEHEFVPYHGFFTTIHFERGTGFIVRSQRESGNQSPYLAEISRRV